MRYRYAPRYRPPSFCTVPPGWDLVERPPGDLSFERRTDLPESWRRFGVIEYDRELTDDEVERYQLDPVS